MIGFFTGSVWGIISGIVLSLALLFVILTVTMGALMATGGPAPCDPATEVEIDQANSDVFQRKWDAFDAKVEAGTPATETFSESEIASRAESWANEEDVPLEDVLVCLRDGKGEASGSVRVLGMTAQFRVQGTLDLSGNRPEAKVDDIAVGNVPGFLMAPVEAILDRALDESLNELEIEHGFTLTLKDGEAELAGVPRTPPGGN